MPKVFVLGPTSVDRTLVCTSLALKLDLMHVTHESLLEEESKSEILRLKKIEQFSPLDLADLIRRRMDKPDCVRNGWILEGFPRNRHEAFLMRKKGIFPTHIAVIEPFDFQEMDIKDISEETKNYLAQKNLILDFHRNSYVRTFTIKPELEVSVEKVLDFVRSRVSPRIPYLPRVLLFGPYGSGRKTVAKRLAEKYNLVEVNYQHELRRAAIKDSPSKEKIRQVLKKSSPIPDDLLVEIAAKRLRQKDCLERGWIMYNFPDTPKQAELLTEALEGFQVNRTVFLDASLEVCLERVEPRRLDPTTGQMYHFRLNPSKQQLPNDRLIQLPQDSTESVEAEHRFYSENAEQLKAFFHHELPTDIVVEVNADVSKEDTFEAVQAAILKSTKMKLPEN